MQDKTAEKIRNKCVEESYRGYGAVIEAVSNYQIAHQFSNVSYELDKANAALTESESMYRAMHMKDDRNALLLSMINGLGFVGALTLFLAFPPANVSIIDYALYSYFLADVRARLDNFAAAISSFNTALVDGKKISDYLHKTSSIFEPSNPISLDTNQPFFIEFKNVSFSYKDKVILNNISFKISPGKKLAITGPTGAGKSTIMKLLLRFYQPSSGSIYVNGIDISRYSLKSLRKHFAVVSQGSELFNDTIGENIRYGDLSATNSEIFQAATLAELVTAETREKLQKNAGQRGGLLSGGERQRTTIARALVKGGAACILDEPTSELDAKTEYEIQQILDKITAEATVLLVTHRLNTVINADTILYLQEGRIIEEGIFQSLMAAKGQFYNQLEVQCQELGIDIRTIQPSSSSSSDSKGVLAFWRRRNRREVVVDIQETEDLQGVYSINSSPNDPSCTEHTPLFRARNTT